MYSRNGIFLYKSDVLQTSPWQLFFDRPGRPVALATGQTVADRFTVKIGGGLVEHRSVNVFEGVAVEHSVVTTVDGAGRNRGYAAISANMHIGGLLAELIPLSLERIGDL